MTEVGKRLISLHGDSRIKIFERFDDNRYLFKKKKKKEKRKKVKKMQKHGDSRVKIFERFDDNRYFTFLRKKEKKEEKYRRFALRASRSLKGSTTTGTFLKERKKMQKIEKKSRPHAYM